MQHSDRDDTTRAVARLPGLEIEIEHRRSPDAERISVHVQAVPSFEVFGRMVECANPFVFWAQTAEMMAQLIWLPFLPWLSPTGVVTPSEGETPRRLPKP